MEINLGDLFEIPLHTKKFAYGQYVEKSRMGPIIRIFDYISEESVRDMNLINRKNYLFPPIITGLYGAIRVGLWRKIGKFPIENYTHPLFILPRWNDQTGEVLDWSLWDGNIFFDLGMNLPQKYKELEVLDCMGSPYSYSANRNKGNPISLWRYDQDWKIYSYCNVVDIVKKSGCQNSK